jgi:DNA-directed RNA polymerase I, II, and III subunit RPABC2
MSSKLNNKKFAKKANDEEQKDEHDYEELEQNKNIDQEDDDVPIVSDSDNEVIDKGKKETTNDGEDAEEGEDDDKEKPETKQEEESETESEEEEGEEEEKPARAEEEEGCLYNFAKDGDEEDEHDDDIGLIDEDEEIKKESSTRITKPFLTKYERVRALGDRAKNLSTGAKPMLKGVDHLSAKEIAKLELEKGVMPFIIERPMPNGKVEIWNINELKIAN